MSDFKAIAQINNEIRFNRKSIDQMIRYELLEDDFIVNKVDEAVILLEDYMYAVYYDSKFKRVIQLHNLDLFELVVEVLVGVAYCQTPELFTSVTAKLANRLGFDDKEEAITTMAEITAVLCQTDLFDITKVNKYASLMVISNMSLRSETIEYINNSEYLPPLVSKPEPLMNNYSSAYLTVSESLILGNGNHHNGDICLDVLDIMNSVALTINTDFLNKVDEEPTFELDTVQKTTQWNRFKNQSQYFYELMINQGNRFYFNHKVDKRGRLYACGYHINSMGNAYKKAMLEFHKQEIVTGVIDG